MAQKSLQILIGKDARIAMRKKRSILIIIWVSFFILGWGEVGDKSLLFSQSAAQSVNLLIDAANVIYIDGPSTIDLAITKSEGGAGSSKLMPAYSNTLRWGIKTLFDNMKISARLDSPMPANSRLFIKMAAPPDAIAERISLSEGLERDAVIGLPRISVEDLPVEIWFYADLNAGPASATRTLTLTLSAQ